MDATTITVSAAKSEEQLGPQALAMMGVTPGDMPGEMWTFSVTCPHRTYTHHALLRPCDGTSGCEHTKHDPTGNVQALADDICAKIRKAHVQNAPCACSESYWVKHGPVYDMKAHLGADQMMGPAPTDCFSAN